MLPRRHFVMRRLDVKSHLLERQDDLAADVLAEIDRREVEVAARVVRFGGRLAVGASLEQEELGLRARPSSTKPLSLARAMTRFSAVRGQPANGVPSGLAMSQMIRPTCSEPPYVHGKHLERREVRLEVHVRFLDADEALDGRAVEHDPAVERLLELPVRHLDVLDDAEDVGELEAEELDLLALDALENARFRIVLRHAELLPLPPDVGRGPRDRGRRAL